MKKQKSKAAFKLISGLVAIALILFFALSLLVNIRKNSGLFKVRDIVIREGNNPAGNIDISFLLGRNIFSIDLSEQERIIATIYPAYKEIKLVRVLPDRLFAYFLRRRPIACVKLSRYFYVDDDAVLFDIAGADPELPLIAGLDKKISGPKAGRKYNLRELSTAINIIKIIRGNYRLRGLKIKKIDVSDCANAAFTISLPALSQAAGIGAIEVKIGQNYLGDKISILASLLIQGKNDWSNINYIDLRFKEPVIKFIDKAQMSKHK